MCWPNGPDLAPDAMHSELTGEPPTPLYPPEKADPHVGAKPRPER